MAVKRAAAAPKKTARKTTARKTSAASTGKGDKLECAVCGLVISIDEPCGEDAPCDIICCGEPMRAKKVKAAK